MAKKKPVLDTLNTWKVCALGQRGGFAHRYIASRIFELVPEKLEKWQIAAISNALHRNEIRVTDWRMGRTSLATTYAEKVSTPVKGVKAEKAMEGLRLYVPAKPKKAKLRRKTG
jgi:hypothetical protein